jgi:hypothetical protein
MFLDCSRQMLRYEILRNPSGQLPSDHVLFHKDFIMTNSPVTEPEGSKDPWPFLFISHRHSLFPYDLF